MLRRCVRSSHWPLRPFVSVQRSPTHRQTGMGIGMGKTESAPVAAAKSAVPSGGTPSGGIPRRATRWSASKAQSASTATGSLGECEAEGSLRGVCGCGESDAHSRGRQRDGCHGHKGGASVATEWSAPGAMVPLLACDETDETDETGAMVPL